MEELATEHENETTTDLVDDCRVMLRFALKNGLQIPDSLKADLTELDTRLASLGLATVTSVDTRLLSPGTPNREWTPETGTTAKSGTRPPQAASPEAAPAQADPAQADPAQATTPRNPGGGAQAQTKSVEPSALGSVPSTELILRAHQALSMVIAPATAVSLQTSEPPPGPHKLLGGMPLIVRLAAIAALLSAVGFAITSSIIAANPKATTTQDEKANAETKPNATSKSNSANKPTAASEVNASPKPNAEPDRKTAAPPASASLKKPATPSTASQPGVKETKP